VSDRSGRRVGPVWQVVVRWRGARRTPVAV